MSNISKAGSREGKTGGITGKEQASLFGIPASAYAINACNLLYHCEGPHKLFYNYRHALLFFSLSLSMYYKNTTQLQQPDTAFDFSNIKKDGRYVKVLFIKKLQLKVY